MEKNSSRKVYSICRIRLALYLQPTIVKSLKNRIWAFCYSLGLTTLAMKMEIEKCKNGLF